MAGRKFQYIVIDCETGGLKHEENPITEVACILLDNDKLKETKRYETYVKPYNNLIITPKALAASRVTMQDVNKGIEQQVLYNTLKTIFIQANPGKSKSNRPIFVGHNITFDIGFIQYLFNLNGDDLFNYINPIPIDTLVQSLQAFPVLSKEEGGYALGFCCKRMGIELKDAHGAMADVIATTALFKAYTQSMRNSDGVGEVDEKTKVKKQRARAFYQF